MSILSSILKTVWNFNRNYKRQNKIDWTPPHYWLTWCDPNKGMTQPGFINWGLVISHHGNKRDPQKPAVFGCSISCWFAECSVLLYNIIFTHITNIFLVSVLNKWHSSLNWDKVFRFIWNRARWQMCCEYSICGLYYAILHPKAGLINDIMTFLIRKTAQLSYKYSTAINIHWRMGKWIWGLVNWILKIILKSLLEFKLDAISATQEQFQSKFRVHFCQVLHVKTEK